jgi:uncharacterized membrane protein YjfL (UPF0719 family)
MTLESIPTQTLISAAAFAGISIAFMFVGKLISDFLTPYNDDDEVREKGNVAVALRTTGLYVGLIIGMAGALAGASAGLAEDVKELAIDGFIVIGTLLVAKAILQFVTLRSIRPAAAAKDGNVAVGIVECSAYIGTGLILNGAFTDVGGTIGGAIVYAFIGQVALALCFKIYEWMTPFKVSEELAKDNRAAAIAVSVRLIAMGLVLNQAIAGPMADWATDLTLFGVYFVFGMLLLSVANWLADLLFLPKLRVGEAVTSGNVAAIVKVAGVQLAAAIIVAAVI